MKKSSHSLLYKVIPGIWKAVTYAVFQKNVYTLYYHICVRLCQKYDPSFLNEGDLLIKYIIDMNVISIETEKVS